MEFDGVDRLLPCPYSLGMCQAIAVWKSNLPLPLIEQHNLDGRTYERGGVEKEVRFAFRDRPRVLPVIWDGQLRIVRWGSTDRSSRLPTTAWTWLNSVDCGKWNDLKPERVDIPACMGFESGVWFKITQGIRGLLVHDETGTPTVYMICETSTRYYRVMTRCERMPVLIGEVI